jgi:hypothetical protein
MWKLNLGALANRVQYVSVHVMLGFMCKFTKYWEKRSDFGKATDFHQGARVTTKNLIFIRAPEFQ